MSATTNTDMDMAALERLGATRHHREAFGTVAQLRLALTGEFE